MKTLLFLPVALLLVPFPLQAQKRVGINTDQPEAELHVNGSMKFSGISVRNGFSKLDDNEAYSFLIKDPNDKITSYNQNFLPQAPAPLNLIQFKIGCHTSDKDWVYSYDTQINSTKYLVIIASFGFTQPIRATNTSPAFENLTPVPQIYAYYDSGTWKFKADYDSFRPLSSAPAGEWTVNLLVFDREYATETTRSFSVNASGTGTAAQAILQ
ncbi:hypothetical protein AAH994_06610 [Weeksellaceae bacterium A-14]